MIYSQEVEMMCPVAQGANHGPAPIPEEAKWVQAKEIKDISGFTHGVGWCAPQQGACKLTLNVKDGIIQEALVETIGCSGMTHSAAMASETLSIQQCVSYSCRSYTEELRVHSLKTDLLSEPDWKTSEKDFVHRLVQCTEH